MTGRGFRYPVCGTPQIQWSGFYFGPREAMRVQLETTAGCVLCAGMRTRPAPGEGPTAVGPLRLLTDALGAGACHTPTHVCAHGHTEPAWTTFLRGSRADGRCYYTEAELPTWTEDARCDTMHADDPRLHGAARCLGLAPRVSRAWDVVRRCMEACDVPGDEATWRKHHVRRNCSGPAPNVQRLGKWLASASHT